MRRMEDQVEQMKLRLEGYEKIEKELDDVVLQSAQSESEINTLTSLYLFPNLLLQWTTSVMQRECSFPTVLGRQFQPTRGAGYSKGTNGTKYMTLIPLPCCAGM